MNMTTFSTPIDFPLPPGYHLSRQIRDAKNCCFRLDHDHNKSLFLKVYSNRRAAESEYQAMSFLNSWQMDDRPLHDPVFRVPRITDFINFDDKNALICEFIEGDTVKQILGKHFLRPLDLYSRMVIAVAHIHELMTSFLLPGVHSLYEFHPINDCQQRLMQLIVDEGKETFTPSEIEQIFGLQQVYFSIFDEMAEPCPCDYYKDANPANWLWDCQQQLVAIDFESQRFVPFYIDFFNIVEYACNYLSEQDQTMLLKLYHRERLRLNPHWAITSDDCEQAVTQTFFAIYRHQEQMLHRLRDLSKPEVAFPLWQREAYLYHLEKYNLHAIRIMSMLPDFKKLLQPEFECISFIYRSAFLRRFGS
jgi:hypothetical protein